MCSLFNKCGVRAWSRERWCLKKLCIVDSGKDINLIFLIMLILSLSSFSRHRRPYGIILIFLPCWRDVTGSWLLKMEMSWLASNYCVKKKKKKKEIRAFGERCQLVSSLKSNWKFAEILVNMVHILHSSVRIITSQQELISHCSNVRSGCSDVWTM